MTGESGTWDPALRGWGGQGRVSCGKWLLRCNLQAEAQVEKKKMSTGGELGQLKLLEGFPKCLGQVREWDQVGLMGPLASAGEEP